MLASLTLSSLQLCSSSSSAVDDGLALFHMMQGALGGADKIAAVRDFEQQVRAESWNGNTGQSLGEVRKRSRWIRSNQLRVAEAAVERTTVNAGLKLEDLAEKPADFNPVLALP